ncbi:hypothetical protein OCK74_17840 [Chitinophagaceae bacterium LB-8]|uniref:DUF3575 domain-containing protein n=1 Tax=Paraflavisolibacter caeni TaxID=2982496 RepID=A0A9X3B8N9_9BACT|nr:hypothetical protein [Paraflavisolibacter caeni]MCU7550985.1 hypothetical protein [Paraflavisolibacter caeni]
MSKQILILIFTVLVIASNTFAQADTAINNYGHNQVPNYKVKQALEVESLVPMFFTSGYHFAVCYRYEKFRLRASVINGGHYNAEPAGLKNSASDFKRYYKTSPGFFFGYNIWKNLELYSFIEFHTFAIEQKSTGIEQNIHSTDLGGGISYQFFIGQHFYIQPGLHLYCRGDKSVDFNDNRYNIPNTDIAPVLRFGFRFWRKY